MTDYDRFTELVPDELKEKIPEKRMHHALWNLADMIKSEKPDLYAAATAKDASDDVRAEMSDLITSKWHGIMEWHLKNGFISDTDHPEEIKRSEVPADEAANKKILALVKPEYMKRIPFFVRGHATGKTCGLIAREFPELYNAFKGDPDDSQKSEMSRLVNGIFAERMAKHNM